VKAIFTVARKDKQEEHTMTAEKKNPEAEKKEKKTVSQPSSLSMVAGDETDAGAIKISESVIAAVVRKYTLEIDGVLRFASASLVGGLAEMIGRRSSESSVVVDLEGEAVNITVTLVLRFGVKVPEIGELVQDVIRSRVEELTGKHVGKVDVIVHDLEDEPKAPEKKQNAE
jgi:uncharacterized alkaline shock family protein YloU